MIGSSSFPGAILVASTMLRKEATVSSLHDATIADQASLLIETKYFEFLGTRNYRP
ncbi:hypothetical protein [Paenibacillus xylanexedens]|uniref:hypothetical protein n=1 Tax=Paenibacillus xylanexedens TaxID=528191 RepID=UPI001C92DD60|nr:hypothetical protein [Paenibacillus xylanexedens]